MIGQEAIELPRGPTPESGLRWARMHGLNPDVIAVGKPDDLVLDFTAHRIYFTEIILDKTDPDYDTFTRRRYVQLEAGPLPFPLAEARRLT